MGIDVYNACDLPACHSGWKLSRKKPVESHVLDQKSEPGMAIPGHPGWNLKQVV